MSKSTGHLRFQLHPHGLHLDCGFISINKKGHAVCGDYFSIEETDLHHILVLSDGQGSGVRANIPATLTAKMLSRMIAGNISVPKAVTSVAAALPVNPVSGLSYATFTVLDMTEDKCYLLQYDNPDAILLRDGKLLDYPITEIVQGEQELHESLLSLQENDVLVITSDGVTNAGMGKLTDEGWGRRAFAAWLQRFYKPEYTATELAASVCYAVRDLNEGIFDDDMTVLVMKLIQPCTVNLMIGPPRNADQDQEYLEGFFSLPGKHVVCGGTTSAVVARHLGKKVMTVQDTDTDGVPCYLRIPGVDLATEGQLTLDKLLDYYEYYQADPVSLKRTLKMKNGASLLWELLFLKATEVNLFYGNAYNPAYDSVHAGERTKKETAEQLIADLRSDGIKVNVRFWDSSS